MSPPHDLERKLATILSADVAEFSRLMAEDEEATLRTFRQHSEVFASLVAQHRGRIFNTAGDAILAEFVSAVEAVRCATEIQAALATSNERLPAERRVRFRIGVNLGDVMVQGQDLLGDGVNIAARLQTHAAPGGICISGSVHDQIRNKLSLSFKPLGERSFKNIPQPVRTFSVVDTEGHGALPSPRGGRRVAGRRSMLWVIAAVVLVAVAGAWGYAEWERRAEKGRAQAEASRQEAAQREARLTAERLAAEEAQRRANAERVALETARKEMQAAAARAAADRAAAGRAPADAGGKAEPVRPSASPPAAPAQPSAIVPTSPTPPAPSSESPRPDGVYAGPLCFGSDTNDPTRCFRARATVENGRISGQWPGRERDVTIVLEGEVLPSGQVKIRLRTEGGPVGRQARAEMSGTLRDGRLDATGAFRNGRPVTLNWRKD